MPAARGVRIFRFSLLRVLYRSGFRSGQIRLRLGLAEDQFQHSWSSAKPGAIRGIGFLWFIGVLRDRLGAGEDQNGELTNAVACCSNEANGSMAIP